MSGFDASDTTAPRAPAASAAVKVSVVIPCFNSTAFIADTLESVLAQTFRDFEIVLVDDGSEDDTRLQIDTMRGVCRDVPMRVFGQPNAGTAAARNCAIAAAHGRYIVPLDADDLIAPTMLQECVVVLDAMPRIDIVYTDRKDFGDIDRVWTAGTFALERLKYFNQLGYCSLYRRSLWEAVGGYRRNVSGFDDWDFWLAAALRGAKALHLRKPLFEHRRRMDSALWRLLPEFERLHAQIVLNNREAYSDMEVRSAQRFLETGEPMSMLRAARHVFVARYYEGYPARPVGALQPPTPDSRRC